MESPDQRCGAVLSSQSTPPGQHFLGLPFDLQLRHFITAAVLVVLASFLTRFLNLAFKRAIERQRAHGTLLPESLTRMALTRRLLNIMVWMLTGALCLSQFPQLRLLSTGLLASAGLSTLVIGFAAQGTLGNAISGLMISVAQPIRLGDDVELRGERGIVEDIHMIFTVLKLADGRRLIIPNNALATEVIKNATLGGVTRVARTDVLVPPGSDAALVREAMLAVARGYVGLDRKSEPDVYYIRITEVGTLLRLVAPCADVSAAEKLVQMVLARASQVVFRRAMS
jgi:small-conductance mechanosensitive channel